MAPSPACASTDASVNVAQLVASRKVVLGGAASPPAATAAALRIEGAQIAGVHLLDVDGYTPALDELATVEGLPVRDFGDRLITPAFVNAHTHLALGFLRGATPPSVLRGNMVRQFYFEIEERLEPGDVEAFARMGAFESLLHGVGLVWDHYYHGVSVARALVRTGLAGVVAPTLQDLDGPGVRQCDDQLAATADIATSDYFGDRGVFAALGPHATDTVSEGLWRRASELGCELDLPTHAHVAQSIEEVRFSLERRGRPPMTWLATTGLLDGVRATVFAHCIYVSRQELALLDPGRDTLVFCPHSQLVFGFPADPLTWGEAGVPWVAATDCSPSNDSMNLQKELRFLAAQRTMPATWSEGYRRFLADGDPADAEAAWEARGASFERAGADAGAESLLSRVWHLPGSIHPAFRAGEIAAGALANLLVWDQDHPAFWPDEGLGTLAMGDTTQAIHAMWVAGREVGHAGDFHRSVVESDLYRDTLAEAESRRHRVLGLG